MSEEEERTNRRNERRRRRRRRRRNTSSIQPLVIDLGSGTTKCGFGGDDAPRAVFKTIVGRPKNPGKMVGMDFKDCFVGDEAFEKRGLLNLNNSPIKRGLVRNWEDMEKIFHHTFYNELRVTPEEHPTVISESPWNTSINREKLTSLMFEKFSLPALYLGVQAVMGIYSSGRDTGVVIDSGYGVTHSVPMYEGYPIQNATIRMDLAGSDITEYLIQILSERGYEMTTAAEKEVVVDIKERLSFISLDYEEEISPSSKFSSFPHCEREYELPDGSKMTIGSERFRAPEILFNPSLYYAKKEMDNRLSKERQKLFAIQELVVGSVHKCDPDLRNDMYLNIVLNGGSTMFENMPDRLTDEVTKILSDKSKVKVHAMADRKFSAWIGGSILSTLSTFQNEWICKEEYDDAGATIVHRKCFGGYYGPRIPKPQQENYGDEKDRIEYVVNNLFVCTGVSKDDYLYTTNGVRVRFVISGTIFLVPNIL